MADDDEKPLDPEAARAVTQVRRLMLIATATTFVAVAVVALGVLDATVALGDQSGRRRRRNVPQVGSAHGAFGGWRNFGASQLGQQRTDRRKISLGRRANDDGAGGGRCGSVAHQSADSKTAIKSDSVTSRGFTRKIR